MLPQLILLAYMYFTRLVSQMWYIFFCMYACSSEVSLLCVAKFRTTGDHRSSTMIRMIRLTSTNTKSVLRRFWKHRRASPDFEYHRLYNEIQRCSYCLIILSYDVFIVKLGQALGKFDLDLSYFFWEMTMTWLPNKLGSTTTNVWEWCRKIWLCTNKNAWKPFRS